MATIVTNEDAPTLPVELRQQAYNVMDCCITGGIAEALLPKLTADSQAADVYEFERSMQGPAFTMALRGICVDEVAARATITALMNAEAHCIVNLRHLAAVWMGAEAAGSTDVIEVLKGLRGKASPGMSPHSPAWVKRLLYGMLEEGGCEEKAYRLKAKKPSNAEGEASSTANEEALLMMQARSPAVGIMTHLILRARELRKLRGFVAARRSPDGRLRSSFNVGATTSGRWSFSKNCFGDGLNFGNIPKTARSMFVPSTDGRVLVNVDLKQAESYIVAHLSNDGAYVAAHETGDAHTAIATDVYAELMPEGCNDVNRWARRPDARLPHGDSPRQLCKKLGHGCLTEDHEVLTPTGWMPIKEAWKSESAIWGGMGFEKPAAWWHGETQDGVIEFIGQGFSQRVTPEHKMLTKVGWKAAKDILKSDRLARTARWYDGDAKVTAKNARLAAALFADGYEDKWGTHFHFRKARKVGRILELGYHLHPTIKYSGRDTTISFKRFPCVKRPAGPDMLKWPHKALEAYVDELQYWDAWAPGHCCHIATTDAGHAEWIQTFCHLLGKGSQRNVTERDETRQPLWRVSINRRAYARVECMQVVEWAGTFEIFCPVTKYKHFMVRRNGHISVSGNTNYGIGERKSSKITGMPIAAITDFRKRFFGKYTGVKARIDDIGSRLLTNNRFVSFMGRPHQHLGHPKDGETQRAALADEPQGAVADILNIVLWRLWSAYDVGGRSPRMYMLSQTYDSILFECERDELDAVRAAVAEAFRVEVKINGRSVVVPYDFGWGANWKEACS